MTLSRLAIGLAALFASLALSQTPGPEGTWRGTLGTGAGALRVVLQLNKAPDGLFTGHLDSVDQGSRIPIDRVTVAGASVRVELKSIGGTFEGSLSADGRELKGTWTQGAPMPLSFTRDTAPPPPPPAAGAPALSGAKPPATFPLGLPLDLRTVIAPAPFVGSDGKSYLAYEVHISNFSPFDLPLEKIEVLHDAGVLASYESAELNAMLALPGSAGVAERRTLPPGRRAVAYLWIPLNGPAPARIRHRISVGTSSIEGAAVSPGPPPVQIGPPLAGDNWLAANGPSPGSGHRRALIAIDGRATIAQRFAIDFVKLGPTGSGTFTGDRLDNKSYHAYGAEAFAVADAIVAATKDGIPENVPGPTSRAVPVTSETIGGNYVVLELGGGRFAFYAHLQPGSLRVKVGDRVKRGQVLGLVGNSGNSTEPHLHFHVSDGVSPLGSEGLPYAIVGMTGMPLQNARVSFKR
jgi:murein DD-endopeptidase